MEEYKEADKDVNLVIGKRKERILSILSKRGNWIYGLVLAFLVWLSIFIRTRNLPLLKDITTGTWTLGPDLDPFLFLRWAKEIVENGSLMAIDHMRYVPLGYNTAGEMKLLSYLMAYFHNFLSTFSLTESVTYSAIVFPVFMFVVTVIAFFFLVRKLFYNSFDNKKIPNIIALVASAFLIVLPSLLPRTIAGIPEKESSAFFFLFLGLYLFLLAWESKNIKNIVIFSILAGATGGAMALIWGGYLFLTLTIGMSVLICFILGKTDRKKILVIGLWIVAFMFVTMVGSTRYSLGELLPSTALAFIYFSLFIMILDFLLFDISKNIGDRIKNKIKLPEKILSLIIGGILVIILTSVVFGAHFIIDKLNNTVVSLVQPLGISRFLLTVAENRQPYFGEWMGSFGPIIKGIPLFFWLFFVGSIYLVYNMLKAISKKERVLLTFSYIVFLFCLIFSRYSQGSVFNGVSSSSKIVLFGGIFFLIGSAIYVYYKYVKEDKLYLFKRINFSYIIVLSFFFFAIAAARSGVRFIMVLAVAATIVVAYFSVRITFQALKSKDELGKIIMWAVVVVVLLASVFTFYNYYQASYNTASNFGPSAYQFQWQKAMSWVRESTPQNAVFSHWWDYGYWLQSIGERATVLDGGNAIVYWNHLLGRHVLTGSDEKEALNFLYTHNTTHHLIDSTDIGKYPAFSSIGADENYDRYSWIHTFLLNEQQIQETSEYTVYFYQGGTVIDEDIIWKDNNGREVFLPLEKAGVGGFLVYENKKKEIDKVEAIFVYQNNQYKIPLTKAYFKDRLYEFDSEGAIEGGVFIFSRIDQGGARLLDNGALLYLSKRTVNSLLARNYLFNEQNHFKLAHSEPAMIVSELETQGYETGEFIYFGGLQGPIKIFEIDYPSDVEFKEEYLETSFPKEELYLPQRSF